MTRLVLPLLLSAAAWILGCAPPEEGEAVALRPGIEVLDARVRVYPGMGAAYLRVVNGDDREDRLLRVETDVADTVEAHETVNDNGVMRMLPRPEGFVVPARGELALEPGGKHLMLIEPRIEAGRNEVELSLVFERHGPLEITAPVLGAGAEPSDNRGEPGDHAHD